MTIQTITHQFIAVYYKQMLALNYKIQKRDLLRVPISQEEMKISKTIMSVIESCRKEALLYGNIELDVDIPDDFMLQPPPPPLPPRNQKGQPLPAQKVTFNEPVAAATATTSGTSYLPVTQTVTVSGGVLPQGRQLPVTHRALR
jgi:hypothetical protein